MSYGIEDVSEKQLNDTIKTVNELIKETSAPDRIARLYAVKSAILQEMGERVARDFIALGRF